MIDIPQETRQLILVTTPSWESCQGKLFRYERSSCRNPIPSGVGKAGQNSVNSLNREESPPFHGRVLQRSENSDEWVLQKPAIPVVVGKNGMAWGLGLHTNPTGPLKKEGDNKAPAGVFTLGPAFGHKPFQTKVDFLTLHSALEAVDDPASRYYNQIVNRHLITDIDWTSSEKMGEIPLYELGLVIHHNWKTPIPGAGSAIFMHLWRDERTGTAGCTAMSYENLSELLRWLDPQKNPLLIQMPQDE